MDPLTSAAAAGLQARMDSFDIVANNLANTSTSGFKADREVYGTYLSAEAAAGADPAVGDSAVVQKHWTDFSQGTLAASGNPTDLALAGSGFFAVNGPSGPLYTRSGNFRVSPQGTLVTAEGYAVRLAGGLPVQLQGNAPIQVSPDGTIAQGNQTLGQLEVVNFSQPGLLVKSAATYFQSPDPKTVAPVAASNVQVQQGKLETSNASPTEAAARMITLLRHFEMLQHAIKLGADMNKQAIEEVARVGS